MLLLNFSGLQRLYRYLSRFVTVILRGRGNFAKQIGTLQSFSIYITIMTEMATLANIDQHPDRDVVIFDGDCNFCRKQVRRLQGWAPGRLDFISLHDPRVATLYPDLEHDALMKEMYLIDGSGNRYAGANAVKYLSRKAPRLWIFAPLFHIPFSMPFWNWCYSLVAKYRYRIAGRSSDCEDGACKIHY